MDTGSPTVLLQQYLAVLTKGSCETTGEEIFDINNYLPKKAYLSSSIKGDGLKVLENLPQLCFFFPILGPLIIYDWGWHRREKGLIGKPNFECVKRWVNKR